MKVRAIEYLFAETLLEMADKAQSSDLKDAINAHLQETQGHVTRLKRVFDALGQKATAKKCEALGGMIEESEEQRAETLDDATCDATIISSAQAVEHYEISRYGMLACWAEQLGYDDAISPLQETLDEEKAADEKLSSIAESSVNWAAA